jgi:hypothetical protein
MIEEEWEQARNITKQTAKKRLDLAYVIPDSARKWLDTIYGSLLHFEFS